MTNADMRVVEACQLSVRAYHRILHQRARLRIWRGKGKSKGRVSNALEKTRVACFVLGVTQHATRNILQGYKVNETHPNLISIIL